MYCNFSQIVLAIQSVGFFAFLETVMSCYRLPLQHQRCDCDAVLYFVRHVQIYFFCVFNLNGVHFHWDSVCVAKFSKASVKDDTKSQALGLQK